jgi:3-hydroxyacyl-[acyl-carrier-protein] dehydratase
LIYRTVIEDLRPEGAMVSGTVHVGDEQIGSAEIFFAHLDQNASKQIFGDHNFVFDGELKSILGLSALNPSANPPANSVV